MYDIEYTDDAEEDLAYFRKDEQQGILSGIEAHLRYQPNVETAKRFRRNPPDVAK